MKLTLSTWARAGVVAALCVLLLGSWSAATASASSAATNSGRCWVMQSNSAWQGPINTTFDDCVDWVVRYGVSDSAGSAYGYWSGVYVLVTANGQVYSALDNGRFTWTYRGQRTPPPTDDLPVVPGIPGPNRNGSYGPFATIRRAIEVANIFKGMGYPNTTQYHDGDGQYVFPHR